CKKRLKEKRWSRRRQKHELANKRQSWQWHTLFTKRTPRDIAFAGGKTFLTHLKAQYIRF
ncbi:TPA: hypothetical protein ACUKC5_004950, partial [Escherichia coli]